MCARLAPFDIEFVEQPTPSWSIEALAHVRAAVDIPIVADQAAFTLQDVYEICHRRAADMICIGPREIGGVRPMLKVAAVAEAAGLKICIHGSFTSGLTTCAEHQAALAIPNLDDGNQIMWQLLADDLVASPDLRPREGWLPAMTEPGLGCTLDRDAVERAAALTPSRRRAEVARLVGLLRGVNVGKHNRVRMADLRRVIEELGYEDVRTLLQSGNVVFTTGDAAATAERKLRAAVKAELGLDVVILVRTRAQLAGVLERNPLAEHATDPKRHLVSFLADKPAARPWPRSTPPSTSPSASPCTAVSSTCGCPTASIRRSCRRC